MLQGRTPGKGVLKVSRKRLRIWGGSIYFTLKVHEVLTRFAGSSLKSVVTWRWPANLSVRSPQLIEHCARLTLVYMQVSKHLTDMSISLPNLIGTSQTTKGRLLHYFPPKQETAVPIEDERIDSWCGFHLDNSLLTGLCSVSCFRCVDHNLTRRAYSQAMFLREEGDKEPTSVSSPSPTSGLYIRTRGGELIKVSIPTDCLAFQTGECLELVTEKRLMATPHCVHIGRGQEKVSRETFALFMQPNTEQKVSTMETFGQFSKRVFAAHYDHSSI